MDRKLFFLDKALVYPWKLLPLTDLKSVRGIPTGSCVGDWVLLTGLSVGAAEFRRLLCEIEMLEPAAGVSIASECGSNQRCQFMYGQHLPPLLEH